MLLGTAICKFSIIRLSALESFNFDSCKVLHILPIFTCVNLRKRLMQARDSISACLSQSFTAKYSLIMLISTTLLASRWANVPK